MIKLPIKIASTSEGLLMLVDWSGKPVLAAPFNAGIEGFKAAEKISEILNSAPLAVEHPPLKIPPLKSAPNQPVWLTKEIGFKYPKGASTTVSMYLRAALAALGVQSSLDVRADTLRQLSVQPKIGKSALAAFKALPNA